MLLPELAGIRRPQWRPAVPALWRDATTVQLGDDVIVDRLTDKHLAWLRLLDGTRTSEQVSADRALEPAEARRLLRALLAAGGIVDASLLPSSLRFANEEQREAAQQRWEAALDHHGDGMLALQCMDARDRSRVAILGAGPLRDALAASLDDAGLPEVATMRNATCLILANAPHPDVPMQVAVGDLDLPHLHVGVRGHRATIGPLVVPGLSGCLTCAHLHRRDADRHWPLVAVQWTQTASGALQADPLVVRLAAAHAVQLLRTWIDEPHRVEAWRDTAVDLRHGESVGRVVDRPPHPLCGCRWAVA